ncbi:MAG TPA: phosphopentomutase, partial [Hyphomicrobiaceae bacterium]|nr:phosphopentomutase [Hyphomicrobiaceae bacterium]
MPRALLLVLDSVGVGGAADAARYGDDGADTVGHIADGAACGRADRKDLREGPLHLPHLRALGLGEACRLAKGRVPPGLERRVPSHAGAGCAAEVSKGKDTPSGHWEIAGAPVMFEWGYFPRTEPCFPRDLLDDLCRLGDVPGTLGNCHASGTEIIARLGTEHMASSKPICYTSADSVFQIAAHEESFGLERLYRLCAVARKLVDPLRIGRVIARPFAGRDARSFARTANRRDYSVPPPARTILDLATADGRDVASVGKIGDIFAYSGTGQILKADGNGALFDRTLEALSSLPDGGLLFTNFIDFGTKFGHRRDVAGYAAALEAFDARLPELLDQLRLDDLLVLTADHGCDPTWRGTDHTRERVPVLALSPSRCLGRIGLRLTFADIGASIARHLEASTTSSRHPVLLSSP